MDLFTIALQFLVVGARDAGLNDEAVEQAVQDALGGYWAVCQCQTTFCELQLPSTPAVLFIVYCALLCS